jgi:hypothetical protein
MDDETVAQIEAALAIRTQGEWFAADEFVVTMIPGDSHHTHVGEARCGADADVMAGAPQWLSALLAERRELVQERDMPSEQRRRDRDSEIRSALTLAVNWMQAHAPVHAAGVIERAMAALCNEYR